MHCHVTQSKMKAEEEILSYSICCQRIQQLFSSIHSIYILQEKRMPSDKFSLKELIYLSLVSK